MGRWSNKISISLIAAERFLSRRKTRKMVSSRTTALLFLAYLLDLRHVAGARRGQESVPNPSICGTHASQDRTIVSQTPCSEKTRDNTPCTLLILFPHPEPQVSHNTARCDHFRHAASRKMAPRIGA